MPRASRRRRPGEERDPALLHSSQTVANVCGELELLRIDCALESIAKLVERSTISQLLACVRLVAATDVLRASVNAPKQIAHALLERIVAVRASEPAGGSEIAECGGAEGAAGSIALRGLHCLMNALKKVGDLWLGS